MAAPMHTPGPWRVLRRGNQTGTRSVLVVGRANVPVCEPANFEDADMLAAAPALLRELMAAYRVLVNIPGHDELLADMDDAIRKANAAAA